LMFVGSLAVAYTIYLDINMTDIIQTHSRRTFNVALLKRKRSNETMME